MYSIDHVNMKCCTPLLQEIHKRVMALSFRDCHTKIRHVDAHATLNEGVVVQVMGELSNNMQPMRKFMQTFVLAPEVCSSLLPIIVMCMWKLDQCVLLQQKLMYCCTTFRVLLQTSSMSTTMCFVTKTRCSAILILSLQKVSFFFFFFFF